MNCLKLRAVDRKIIYNALRQLVTTNNPAPMASASEIKVPTKIERKPTDILQALEGTISRDPTAPDYKYLDDPFLIPTSLSKKRMYSLSKESGKRAAMWVLQEHADLLKSDLSEPIIEAFLPEDKYSEKSQVSEELLLKLIDQGRISDVVHVYNLLEGDVANETKLAVLEMLCFYNSDLNQISEDFPEERSYQQEPDVNKNTWSPSHDIDKLFEELKQDEKTVAGAYNALISGTAKYLQVEQAWKLYNECLDNKIPVALTTYNYLMQLVPMIKDNHEDRLILMQTLLQHMVDGGIKPNIRTLNSALKGVATLQIQTAAKDLALSLLAEFQTIGVKPSLASYHYILLVFCRSTGQTSHILLEILDELEKKEELVMEDPSDIAFFVNAMEVANLHINNLSAGDRLHKLLLTKNNYKFIGGRLKESIYYRNYLQLILNNESIDDFMKVYDTLVPNIYVPEPALMRHIIQILEANEKEKATQLMPRLLSHMIMFDMLDRHQIMKLLLKLLTWHCSPPTPESPLHKQYAEFANTLWTHILETNQKRLQRTMWPATIFANMAVLFLRNNEFEKTLDVLYYLVKSQDAVIGAMDAEKLNEIFEACIVRGHTQGAMAAVEYSMEFGMAYTNHMAQRMKDALPLSDAQENQLITMVGMQGFKSEE